MAVPFTLNQNQIITYYYNLPTTMNKRLSEISSNENVFFNIHKNEYQDAFKNSGYNTKLNYKKNKK